MKRDILSVMDMEKDLLDIIDLSIEMKGSNNEENWKLENKVLGMIFEKPSTRTRVSLEVAMHQLGGHSIYLNSNDMQLGKGETISDTGHVLSRMLDAITYRAYKHKDVVSLAESSSIPVVNALDDIEHPLQAVADIMTIKEKKHKLNGLKLAFIGDGNNVSNSLMLGSALLGIDFYIASPKGYETKKEFIERANEVAKDTGAKINLTNDPIEAAANADVIYTDVWVSMGEEKEKEERERAFRAYQVNSELVKNAKKDYLFMHCLPAHRGMEVTDEVADSKNSVIFDEAENRMHSAKAVLYAILGK